MTAGGAPLQWRVLGREYRVHVVRHDRPGMQPIAIGIEPEKRAFDQPRNCILFEPTSAPSPIQHIKTHRFGLGGLFQTRHRFCRQAVGQAKRDELGDVRRIEVREVVTRMPAFVLHVVQANDVKKDAPLEWRAPSGM